jgi:hypothetical protein
MKVIPTESDLMAADIAAFTDMIVDVAITENVPNVVKAEAIHNMEVIFHKFIMGKILEKCQSKAVPSYN